MIPTLSNLKLEKVNTDDFQTKIQYDFLKIYGIQAGVFKGYKWFIYYISKQGYNWSIGDKLMESVDMYHIHVEYKPNKIPFEKYQEYLYKYICENRIKVSGWLTQPISNYHWIDGLEVNYLKGTLENSSFDEARRCIFQYINVFNEIDKQDIIF